jgi:hypothetical protein
MTESPKLPRKPGALKGKIWISDDFYTFTEQDEQDWYSWSEPPGDEKHGEKEKPDP